MVSDALPRTPGAWHQRIWRLTWPVILANITIPLVGVADVAVMGRLPDPALIGAVTMGAAMFSAVYWLFGFLRMGTTGLAAQAFGRADIAALATIFLRGLTVAAALGIFIVLLQWPLAELLFALFDASHRVTELAGKYYSIRIYGAPALLIYLVELGILFGLQRMRDTLWLSIGLNVSNLLLDVVLVLGFGMGVAGVTAGTLISEWGAAAGGLFFVWRALHAVGWTRTWPADILQSKALRALFHLDGVDADSLAMYEKRVIPRMLGKLSAPSIAFEPLPDGFNPVYVRDGYEYRPNIEPAGFVVLNTRTRVLYGVRDGLHYFPGVTRVLVAPGAPSDRLVQMMVVGMASPPVRFAGHCDIMQSNGKLKRMVLESNDSGNQTVALMAQHIAACRVTNTSARGTLWMRLQEGEAVVFDKKVSAPGVTIDYAR